MLPARATHVVWGPDNRLDTHVTGRLHAPGPVKDPMIVWSQATPLSLAMGRLGRRRWCTPAIAVGMCSAGLAFDVCRVGSNSSASAAGARSSYGNCGSAVCVWGGGGGWGRPLLGLEGSWVAVLSIWEARPHLEFKLLGR